MKAAAAACKQDQMSVQDYYDKIKLIWDYIDDYEPPMECCCGTMSYKVNTNLLANREREIKYQFLMGLDGVRYGGTRSIVYLKLMRWSCKKNAIRM